MPETPELTEDLEVEVPQPDVPLREGEERHAAGLNLDHLRRREAEIGELRAALKRLEGTSADTIRTRYASSPSARRRQISARKKMDELTKLTFKRGDHWEGPCAPATVINLNPVPLHTPGRAAAVDDSRGGSWQCDQYQVPRPSVRRILCDDYDAAPLPGTHRHPERSPVWR